MRTESMPNRKRPMRQAIQRTNKPSDCSIDAHSLGVGISHRQGSRIDWARTTGAELDADQPIEHERNDLRECIDYLAQFPQVKIAAEIGVS